MRISDWSSDVFSSDLPRGADLEVGVVNRRAAAAALARPDERALPVEPRLLRPPAGDRVVPARAVVTPRLPRVAQLHQAPRRALPVSQEEPQDRKSVG